MLHLKLKAELFSICKSLQRSREKSVVSEKAINMVMPPHSQECIKIPFVDVNCCSIAWSLWISWSPYKHRKLFSETWVEGKPHLLYHFRRSPSCPRALQWEISVAFVNVNCSVMKRIQLFSGSFITAFTLEKYCSTI